MKNFKNYPREYEFVFSSDEVIQKKCKIEEISLLKGIPTDINKYINLTREAMGEWERNTFDSLVKIVWLFRRYHYRGRRRERFFGRNGYQADRSFAVFLRHYVGFDARMFVGRNKPTFGLATYIYDLFPGFDEGNPFEEKYEYPFKYMNLGCLYLVREMDERMELLKYCENRKMKYTEFLDYILNYVNCYNNEHGDKYIFNLLHTAQPIVRLRKNYEESKACYFFGRGNKPLQRKQLRTELIAKSIK